MSFSSASDKTVYDPDHWSPGHTLMISNVHWKMINLPIEVDNLAFHNCTFDVLDLKWLDGESLRTLSIHACRIREVRGLSESLKTLRVHHSNIEYIELVPNLETLVIDVDRRDSHPNLSAFPETLKRLSLHMRHLRELQPLPAGLTRLTTVGSGFPLPNPLPPNLIELICFEMVDLIELPPLPESLTYLDCAKNRIHCLPDLPPRLQYLDCSSNWIGGELPALPSSLQYFDCSHNVITAIPRLPPYIRRLDCDGNNLRELPPLPASLRTLHFRSNPIERYPYIYDPSMYVLISIRGRYCEALGSAVSEKIIMDGGAKVFAPALDPEIKEFLLESEDTNYDELPLDNEDDDYDFADRTGAHNETLKLVLEVQRQVDTHSFMLAIKEELIAVTWHPHRVEAWCGVDFSDPESD